MLCYGPSFPLQAMAWVRGIGWVGGWKGGSSDLAMAGTAFEYGESVLIVKGASQGARKKGGFKPGR
jgi:hypothetical protein